jgi:hypothetical protein
MALIPSFSAQPVCRLTWISKESMVRVYPTRMIGEHIPSCEGRLEVRSSTRRHRALVRRKDAAVVMGVLGYDLDDPAGRVLAAQFLTRARAWQAQHDPSAVRDPESAGAVTWTPDPAAAQTYQRCPAAYRPTFSAFTITARPPGAADWISWRAR